MRLLGRASRAGASAIARLPWQLRLAAGVLLIVVGAVLVVRPFLSLGALVVVLALSLMLQGIAELLRTEGAWASLLAAVAWIVGGLLVLVWPGLAISGLTLIVGVGLIAGGAAGAIRALRGARDRRLADLLLGLASVVLGVLALTWPDVTVFVLAAVLGVRMMAFGVDLALADLRSVRSSGVRADASSQPARRGTAGWVRTTGAVLALATCAALLLVSVRLDGTPRPDAFYDPPAAVPAEPGQLLRSEPFARTVPAGASGWRILYTTTAHDGGPTLASALVVVPGATAEAHPVIAWAHGTTGYANGCAPSLLDEPFVAGAMPGLDEAIAQGWAVVATDYAGLGTEGAQPYLVGEGEARSVLDAVRAAQQLSDAGLAAATVLWGHSQGGHAALWAAGRAAAYAPELELLGVAAMAPASDLPVFLDGMADSLVGPLFGSFALAAYSDAYPEVERSAYVRPGARIMLEEMERRCLTDPSTLVSVATSLAAEQTVWGQPPGSGPLAQRVAENVPRLPIVMPVLLAQGGADPLITPEMQQAYVTARCAEGTDIDYRVYDGLDHMGLVTGDSALLPALRTWTAARFAGAPAAPGCG